MNKQKIVAVDVGNSHISCGLFSAGCILETWFHSTQEVNAAALSITSKANKLAVLSSVVPHTTSILRESLVRAGLQLIELPTGKSTIISGVYKTMGSDRIANAVAAWKIYAQENVPVIVLDLGTATTLTAINKDGAFAGGFITLGLGKAISTLHQATAQLPVTKLKQDIAHELCFNTESAILSGTLLGHIGLLETWIKIARQSLGDKTKVIATGGWSQLISNHSHAFDAVDPLLTLKGVYLTAQLAMDQGDLI